MAEIITPPNKPICPACGISVDSNDQFCKSCGRSLSELHSTIGSLGKTPNRWETNKGTNPWLVVLGIVGVFFVVGIIGSALTGDSDDEVERPAATPTVTPDWRTFMDDRDVNLLSSGIERLGRRHDVLLDEYKVRRFIAQNLTDKLAEESGWMQFWLWILTVIGGYDEQDVANDLEDAIYDDGEDVREVLESFKICCAANP